MKKTCILPIVTLLMLAINYTYAQAPIVPIPHIGLPNTQLPNVPNPNAHHPLINNRTTNTGFNQQAHQAELMREMQAHQRSLKETEKQKEYAQDEMQRQYNIVMLTNHGFPMQSDKEGTAAFYNAYDEIEKMLKGNQPLNLGRAVFLTENAYHNNKYDYNDYKNAIKANIDFCNKKIVEEKLEKNDNLVKNMMLFRFISDTLKLRDKATRKLQTHYPIKYDYDDYQSKKSYDSHFVTTLMQTGKGQCHSMPLYYLVLAEEIGADAYWSFSPRHSFVKIQDEDGVWYNLELTCKAILSDTHYMNSGYIKSEALQNRIYLEAMDKTNVVAEMMVELARAYYQKYGYDDFYLKCVETAQQHLKNDLNAKMLKSAYQTSLTLTLAQLLNAPNPDAMKEIYPQAYPHFELMQAQYKEIDDMGYEELPISVYSLWLDHIAKEKEKAEKTKLPSIFIKKPKKD